MVRAAGDKERVQLMKQGSPWGLADGSIPLQRGKEMMTPLVFLSELHPSAGSMDGWICSGGVLELTGQIQVKSCPNSRWYICIPLSSASIKAVTRVHNLVRSISERRTRGRRGQGVEVWRGGQLWKVELFEFHNHLK